MDAYGVSPSIHEKYDVFLSFRGEDTRNNFTSHLYAALRRKQIKTYIDEKSLERGDDITLALPEAIQKSKISIIIFSKGYASSSWCLRELVHILECRRENKQMVIPIFYEVDPSHIRKEEGSYGEAFLKHQERFKDRIDIMQKWRAALIESTDLSGWDSQVTRPESELVEAIVDDVLRKLNLMSSSDTGREDLIGMKEHIQETELLLSLGSADVRVVGIWGLGGIGKTTLADLVFNKHCYQFESCCFLANVREESQKLGLINLRDKLLSELLKGEKMNFGTLSLPPQVKDRLCRQKVLVVLDDVNDSEQLQVLIGDRDMFGYGSRIIVTTRDAQVLKDIQAHGTYKVEPLDCDEALRLFKSKAFRENSPTTDYYIKLSKEVVKYAGGIPLALNVLASHLRSLYPRSIGNWETVLSCLKDVANDDIEKKLRISYDGLNEKERAIFLDIACFFKGERRELVENILNGCGFSASIRINNLVNKSLVTVSCGNKLEMHDLVQEMGWKIVHQLSEEQPGQQSRLWIAKDAYRVLNKNECTKKIEGIFLDMAMIDKELHLRPNVFQKMGKLRLLKIYNTITFDNCFDVKRNKVYLHQDLRSFPSTTLLHWEGYPSKHLPSNFDPHNLVEINMPYSQIEQISNEVQDFDNLKSIDLRHCIHLTQFPDFSHAPKLEKINLEGSKNLLQVSSHSVQNLGKLIDLNLSHCNKLQNLPMTISRSLVSLNLSSTAIMFLPSSIGSLKNLSKLHLNNCTSLAELPSSMNQLDSLRRLELNDCSFLETFPTLPWNIEVLEIRRTAIKEVASSSIERRHVLKIIDMLDNQSLVSLPSSIFELRSLHTLHLSCCSNLKNLPEIPGPIKSLKCLNLERSGIRELSSSIEHLISIESLDMDKCKSLESVPSSICNMASLSDLKLSNCPKLEYFPASAGFLHWDLERLVLINSNVIEIPESIKRLPKLRELRVNSCTRLRSLPELPPSLQFLDASGCESLEVVSNSKRALAQEFWDYTHVAEKMLEYSIFCDCSKLNHDGLHNIIIDFQLRVFRNIAMRPLSMEYQSWNGPEVHACCPGNEIPKWFEYQTEGCCINMKLPPQWHNSNFLGFVVCAKGDSYSFAPQLGLYCRLNLIPAYGENHIFTWAFTKWDCGYEELPTTSYSSHLYMWYEHEDYHDCLDAVEASFDFSFEEFVTSEDHWNNSSKIEVKKCGVHMLYGKDLQEFGLNLGAFSDQLAHIGTVNSDTDEPRLKKIKFTNPSNC